MDSVRRRLSFSSSPPPSPSPSNTSSMSASRLSKEQINEILTSPYETGYTYSDSAAYRHDASAEFTHPRLCRRIVSASTPFQSDPNLLMRGRSQRQQQQEDYGSRVTYALRPYGPLKPKPRGFFGQLGAFVSGFPRHAYWQSKGLVRALFFYALSIALYAAVFAGNLLVSSAGGGWALAKMVLLWLFKYFVLAPILGPYYLVMKHYRKARRVYSFSVWLHQIYRQFYPVTLESSGYSGVAPSAPPFDHLEEPSAPVPSAPPLYEAPTKSSGLNGGGGGGLSSVLATLAQLGTFVLWLLTLGPLRDGYEARSGAVSEPVGTRTRSHYAKYTSRRIVAATVPAGGERKEKRVSVVQSIKWIYWGGIPRAVYRHARDNPSKARQALVWVPLALLLLYLGSHAWLLAAGAPQQQQQQTRHFPLSAVDALSRKVTARGDALLFAVLNAFSGALHALESLFALILRGIGLTGIFVAEFLQRVASACGNALYWARDALLGALKAVAHGVGAVLSGAENIGELTGEKVANALKRGVRAVGSGFSRLLELNHSLLVGAYRLLANSLSYLVNGGRALLVDAYHMMANSLGYLINGGRAVLVGGYRLAANSLGYLINGAHALLQELYRLAADSLGYLVNGGHALLSGARRLSTDGFVSVIELNHSLLQKLYRLLANSLSYVMEANHRLLQWLYRSASQAGAAVKGGGGSTVHFFAQTVQSAVASVLGTCQWLLSGVYHSFASLAGSIANTCEWLLSSVYHAFASAAGSIANSAHNLHALVLQGLSSIGASLGTIPIDRRQYPQQQQQQQAAKQQLKFEHLPDDHPIMANIKRLIDSTLAEERRAMEQQLKQRVGQVQQEAETYNQELRDEYEAKISKLLGEERELVHAKESEEWVRELEKGMDKKLDHLISLMNSKVTEQNSKFHSELEELRRSYLVLVKQQEAERAAKHSQEGVRELKRAQEIGESAQMEQVRQLIKEYIQRYDADKTGLPDYALESSGGAVASIRCTVPYNERSRTQMLFGIPLWYSSYSPRSVIQRKGHGASAGECWAFEGPHGYLAIKLAQRINVTAVSYEHLPVQLSPDGHIKTAPKQFLVYSYQGVDELDSRFLLGNFTYDDRGEPLQMFPMQHRDPRGTPVIELETLSNHGAQVTCLYRFRVHGTLATAGKDEL